MLPESAELLLLAVAALIPADPATLTVSNIRFTYGALGVNRPEGKLLPGDSLFVGFDTEGVSPQPKSTSLKNQCALLVGGETYSIDLQNVGLKVSKGEKATISGRSGQ